MNYLVMECHPGYAVVLDESGRFLKVANLGYTVGETVTDVVTEAVPKRRRPLTSLLSLAACLCIVVLGVWSTLAPYGSVQMKINPHVEMTVNRFDRVTHIVGLNADGTALIEGYAPRLKTVDQVSDELADLAAAMGYLKDGSQIRLSVESSHAQWQQTTEERLVLALEVHIGSTYTVVSVPLEELLEEGLEDVVEDIVEDALEEAGLDDDVLDDDNDRDDDDDWDDDDDRDDDDDWDDDDDQDDDDDWDDD